MSLQLNVISGASWISGTKRSTQPQKWFNARWVEKLNTLVKPLANPYEGVLFYNSSRIIKTNVRSLTLRESSPVFQLMHLYSNSFTDQTNYQELNYWKKSSIDNSIIERFKALDLNKYTPGQNKDIDFDSYVLVPLQSLDYQFDLKTFVDIIKWSKENKRLIVLKLHPFTEPTNYIFPILKKLKYSGLLEYVKVVTHRYNIDTLIEKSDKVWMFNSGVALNSIIRGKPTSVFWNCVYSPLCKRCYSPEEADANPYPNDDTVYKYLSWFYHRFTIDIGADTATDRFIELFNHFYRDQKSLELYMNIDWK
jgi:hypothetical protein